MEFDSRAEASSRAANRTGAGSNSTNCSGGSGRGGVASVYLIHLKSFAGMGTAAVECVSGCSCTRRTLDGTWDTPASLQQMRKFTVRGLRPAPPAQMLARTRKQVLLHAAREQEMQRRCAAPSVPNLALLCVTLHCMPPY